jgi:hypothetical protein
MTRPSRIFAGLLLLSMVTIEAGGGFLLRILAGEEDVKASSLMFPYFRAGHAHAGVLVILALVSMLYVDRVRLGARMKMTVRVLMSAAPLLISGGMFGAGAGLTADGKPGPLAALIGLGAISLAVGVVILGVSLLRTRDTDA